MFFEGGVQILHIRAVVHVVMQSHSLLVDRRFQCVIGIGERGYFVSHCYPPDFSDDGNFEFDASEKIIAPGQASDFSREAAQECSPRRKPWDSSGINTSPCGAKEQFPANL